MKARVVMALMLAVLIAAFLPTTAVAGMHDGHGRPLPFGMTDGHGFGMHDGHG